MYNLSQRSEATRCFSFLSSLMPGSHLREHCTRYILSKWTCSGESSAWNDPLLELTTSNFTPLAWLDGAFWLDISYIYYPFNLRAKQVAHPLQRHPILEPNHRNPILEPNCKRLLIIPKYYRYVQIVIAQNFCPLTCSGRCQECGQSCPFTG